MDDRLNSSLRTLEADFLAVLCSSDQDAMTSSLERLASIREIAENALQSKEIRKETLVLLRRVTHCIFTISTNIVRTNQGTNAIHQAVGDECRPYLKSSGTSAHRPGFLKPRRPTRLSSTPLSPTTPSPTSSVVQRLPKSTPKKPSLNPTPRLPSTLSPTPSQTVVSQLLTLQEDLSLYAPYRRFFHDHFTYPYPTKSQKETLINQVKGADLKKCTTWFENQRKRGSHRSGWGDLVGKTPKNLVKEKLEGIERGEEGEEVRQKYWEVKKKFVESDDTTVVTGEEFYPSPPSSRNVSDASTSSSLSSSDESSPSSTPFSFDSMISFQETPSGDIRITPPTSSSAFSLSFSHQWQPQEPANDYYETLFDQPLTTDIWNVVSMGHGDEMGLVGIGGRLAEVCS